MPKRPSGFARRTGRGNQRHAALLSDAVRPHYRRPELAVLKVEPPDLGRISVQEPLIDSADAATAETLRRSVASPRAPDCADQSDVHRKEAEQVEKLPRHGPAVRGSGENF